MVESLVALQRERDLLHAYCQRLCNQFAYAHVAGLPVAAALRRVMDSRYDQLAALDIMIASTDQQQGLFPDDHEAGP
jgi:hypothetical protein